MGGCFRFFVGLFCAMLALEVLAELFSWTDVPFDALLLLGFGPRTPQAAAELAAKLHPELARAP